MLQASLSDFLTFLVVLVWPFGDAFDGELFDMVRIGAKISFVVPVLFATKEYSSL